MQIEAPPYLQMPIKTTEEKSIISYQNERVICISASQEEFLLLIAFPGTL